MNWKLKRQLIAAGIVGLLMAIVVFALYFWFNIVAPSNDGVKSVEVLQPIRLIWSRFFFVRQGVYDVTALLENPNDRAKAAAIPYVFRLFDENDILIATKQGIGFINPGERFVIVEPLIATGVRVPKRVLFETRDAAWQAGEKKVLPIAVKQKRFEANGMDTIVRATLANADIHSSVALEAVSILVDAEGNATAVSRAVVDPIVAGEEREVVFTWPRVLPEPNTIQIYVRERN